MDDGIGPAQAGGERGNRAIGIGATAVWVTVKHRPAAPPEAMLQIAGPAVPVQGFALATETPTPSNGPKSEAPRPPDAASSALVGPPSLAATPGDPLNLYPTVPIAASKPEGEDEGAPVVDSPASLPRVMTTRR